MIDSYLLPKTILCFLSILFVTVGTSCGPTEANTESGCPLLTPADANGGVTLEEGSCFQINERVRVTDGDLTIEPGVRLIFAEHTGLSIRHDSRLIADASGGDPITFEGLESASSGSGFWRGIKFYGSFSRDNVLNNIIITDAGSTGWTSISPEAAIYIQNTSQVHVTDIAITNSKLHGIEVTHGSYLNGCEGLSFEGITGDGKPINTNRTNEHRVCDDQWF